MKKILNTNANANVTNRYFTISLKGTVCVVYQNLASIQSAIFEFTSASESAKPCYDYQFSFVFEVELIAITKLFALNAVICMILFIFSLIMEL